MTGTEIVLIVLLAAAALAILVLANRNAELTRSTKKLFALLKQPAPVQTLPPAAEFIKLSNFDRATSSRDQEIASLRQALAAVEGAREADRQRHDRRVGDLQATLATERQEHARVAGLYKEAECERQRLSMENRRLATAVSTSVN